MKLWTILAWYLYLFVQNWKCRTSTKELRFPPWASSIATLYHPPVRNEELRLSFLLAHSVANGEKRSVILLSACASYLPYSAVGLLVPHSSQFPASSLSPVCCLQFPARQFPAPVPCLQFSVPSSLSPVCCPQFPAQVPCPSSLPPVPCPVCCPQFPVRSSLSPVCCLQFPPLPCPQFPVPSSLSPLCRPRDLRLYIQQLEISLA